MFNVLSETLDGGDQDPYLVSTDLGLVDTKGIWGWMKLADMQGHLDSVACVSFGI